MAITAAMLATCLIGAAEMYSVPPAVMVGILHVEGGRVGQEVRNTNGSYDMGPMQINTVWLPQLANLWNVDQATARRTVRDDGCVNMYVSAWILRQQIDRAGHLYGGIARYHSATPHLGQRYAQRVVRAMQRHGLIAGDVPIPSYRVAQQ